jgi:hypothetical protein
MMRYYRRIVFFTSAIVAVVCGLLFIGMEKNGTVSSTEELGVHQAEKRILASLKLSRPIVFWTRPFIRPSTAYLASTKSDTFRGWQSECCSKPMDLVSIRAIDYWIERLKPNLPKELIEQLSRVNKVESCQANFDRRVLRVYFIPELEVVLIVSLESE